MAELDASQVAEGTQAQPVSEAQDAPATDESYALPDDFESLGDEAAGGDEIASGDVTQRTGTEGRAPAAPQRTATEGQAQQRPATQQAPAPKPQAQAAPAPQQVQPQQQPTASEAGRAPRREDVGQILGRLAANKEALLGELRGRFNVQLSKEETDGLNDDAVAALPQILSRVVANLYYENAVASMTQIQNLVPHMVSAMMESSTVHAGAERAFYATWPGINPADENHTRTVNQFANFYRQNNPRATQKEAIDAVGKAVSAFLGLPLTQRQGVGNARGAAPAGRRPAPFAPAGGGRGLPTPPPNGAGGDPFHGMGMEFDE
jgi:hypothetical protein